MNFFDFYSEPEDFGVRRRARRGEIRDVLRDFCHFPLPCLAAGCHTETLKIAAAALRPRNDTKSGRFLFGKQMFYAVIFCTVSLRIVFQMLRFGNCSVFPQNPPDLSLRGGRILAPDVAILKSKGWDPGTKYASTRRDKARSRRCWCRM